MTETFWSQFIPALVGSIGTCAAAAGGVAKWYVGRKLEQDRILHEKKLEQERQHHAERIESEKATQEVLGMIVSMLVAVMSEKVTSDDMATAITERVNMQFKKKTSHENAHS